MLKIQNAVVCQLMKGISLRQGAAVSWWFLLRVPLT